MAPSITYVAATVTCLKLLLIPSYRSTDFEVHRNWLAITYSLPINKWYYEDTSIWTLDYPPLFAWFEFGLSQIAQFFDPQMLVIHKDAYASLATIYFQRLSVIFSDFLLIYAVHELCTKVLRHHGRTNETNIFYNRNFIISVMLIANFGLLIVDRILKKSVHENFRLEDTLVLEKDKRNIHFQYNGFLFGLLLLSVVRICQGKHIQGAFWFAVLLNFKHIFLYISPAYFIYLLRCYCFKSTFDGKISWRSFSFHRFISLGLVVLSVFAMSFGPFIYLKQIPQILSRLFPFKRGLCHAYWAPNFWAVYNVIDKAAVIIGLKAGYLDAHMIGESTMTGGLVQEFRHTVLPSVKPHITLLLTIISILPILMRIWSNPQGIQSFLQGVILCAFGSFLFGWHVHEKAILLILIPFSLLVLESKRDAGLFLIISTVGNYSLFPLLFTQKETPIKICAMLLYTLYLFMALSRFHGVRPKYYQLPLLSTPESLYLVGLVPLECFNSLLSPMLGLDVRLPFLSLMLTSVYCSLGLIYSWFKFYYHILLDNIAVKKDKQKTH